LPAANFFRKFIFVGKKIFPASHFLHENLLLNHFVVHLIEVFYFVYQLIGSVT